MPTRTSISVALCTFNGRRYLRAQLNSIFNQSRRPDEIVVCDDGSDDGTAEWVGVLLQASGLPHRVIQNRVRLGVSQNFDQAIRLCTHDLVVLSDQDDVWRHDRLEQLEAAFGNTPDASVVFSNARVVDSRGTPLGYTQWDSALFGPHVRRKSQGDVFPVLLRYPVACGATMGLRREIAQRCLPIAEEWLHDEWLALLCAATSNVHHLDAELVDYRIHTGQVVGAQRLTLGRQLATARKMNQAYYDRQIRRFTRLEERLQAWTPKPRAEVLAAVRGKLAYLRALQRLRAGHANPWWVSTGLLLDGSHHRFELGFKSWLLGLGYNYAFGSSSGSLDASPSSVDDAPWRFGLPAGEPGSDDNGWETRPLRGPP
jgi:glycosyltransferase involved in cell wall biosynthesis